MSCKFIWFSLPIKIKKAVGAYNSQLSSEVKKIEWYNLPKKINLLYDELYIIKGAQGFLPKPSYFIWYNLPNKLQALCNLLDFEEPEPSFNFDVRADWDYFTVTDEASFIANSSLFFIDATFVNVSNFSLVGNRLRCNIETDSKSLNMYGDGVFGIKEVIAITNLPSLIFLNIGLSLLTEFNPTLPLPENLTSLQLLNTPLTEFNPTLPLPNNLVDLFLQNNQLTKFNLTLPLPSSLITLNLQNNQITTQGYEDSEPWATAQPSFISLNGCRIFFNGNPDSPIGTNFETILATKNVTLFY
jgi:hypothetical protein